MAEGHRQRLRDRFLKYGLDSFTDEEIIELLLALGTPRKDCKKQARDAYKRFGSLAQVMDADLRTLQQIKGIGPNNAFAVKFVHEVARRFLKERLKDKKHVRSAKDVVDYLCHRFSFQGREIFSVIYLDSNNGVIDVEELFSGTVDSSAVYPREIMKIALLKNAVSLIFAHNHPSGSIIPSEADKGVTKKLLKAANLLGIRILDHIIIAGPSKYFSFSEAGLLDHIMSRG